jgi:hypothetical protein
MTSSPACKHVSSIDQAEMLDRFIVGKFHLWQRQGQHFPIFMIPFCHSIIENEKLLNKQ